MVASPPRTFVRRGRPCGGPRAGTSPAPTELNGCMRELLRALQPRAVLGVRLAEALMRAEDVMFAHVLGVAARRRLAAERLGHGADGGPAGAAGGAEIAPAELVGPLGERGDLPAVAGD